MLPCAGGLIATALVNVAFGFGHAYLWFCVCWGANGLLQVLTHTLPPAHPLNTSRNDNGSICYSRKVHLVLSGKQASENLA